MITSDQSIVEVKICKKSDKVQILQVLNKAHLMNKRVNQPVRCMRISEELWQEFRLYRHLNKLSCNRLLRRMLEADKTLNSPKQKEYV